MIKKVLLIIGSVILPSCEMHPLEISDDTYQA